MFCFMFPQCRRKKVRKDGSRREEWVTIEQDFFCAPMLEAILIVNHHHCFSTCTLCVCVCVCVCVCHSLEALS